MDLSNNIVITSVDDETINGTKDEECIELKHIQYKTMIQNGVSPSIDRGKGSINDLNTLEKFLENTTEINKTERWNKLDMTVKLNKICISKGVKILRVHDVKEAYNLIQ